MKNIKNIIDLNKYKSAISILFTAGDLGEEKDIDVFVVLLGYLDAFPIQILLPCY